jgi:hypothetical protein
LPDPDLPALAEVPEPFELDPPPLDDPDEPVDSPLLGWQAGLLALPAHCARNWTSWSSCCVGIVWPKVLGMTPFG